MAATQRFCPLCDRTFIEGEAVLRCDGCQVLHHPGCWVKNDGCASAGDHRRAPIAVAYTSQRPLAAHETHPAEGTRINLDARREAMIGRAAPQSEAPSVVIDSATAPTQIGGEDDGDAGEAVSPFARKRPPAPYVVGETPGPRRYQPPADPPIAGRPLPKLYGGPRFLRYWYVPAAALVALGVAFGVIFAAEKLFGDDGPSTPAAVIVPATSPSPATTPVPATPATAAATPSASASPTPAGKFRVGDTVVVTGAGDCLNVRTAPGRDNQAITCLTDGTQLTVKGGPESASDLRWWQVTTPQGDGWAAEDFLSKKP